MWKNIVGYEGKYQISDTGEVKSLIGHAQEHREKILKPLDCFGYSRVLLVKNHKRKYHRIHVLVARHFIPNPENKPTVNHKNGNKKDNMVNNLEWMTSKEQTNHAIKCGLMNPKRGLKIAYEQHEEIFNKYKFRHCTLKQLGFEYGVHFSNIHLIVKRFEQTQ